MVWYAPHSASSSASRPILPSASLRTFDLSSLGRPEGIGPPGTRIEGRCPKCSAPITRPGTILSQIPSSTAASKTSCVRATAVPIAMTSRLKSDSSIPGCPWVTPSHIAGTPPANCAVAPTSRTASLITSG